MLDRCFPRVMTTAVLAAGMTLDLIFLGGCKLQISSQWSWDADLPETPADHDGGPGPDRTDAGPAREDAGSSNIQPDGGREEDGGRPPTPGAPGYLHVEGNRLLDSAGNAVRLTGINWFGFETQNMVVHGLWSRDYKDMLRQIADIGFNSLRLPWSNAILAEGAMPQSIGSSGPDGAMNEDLQGKTALEALDAIIEEAGNVGLRVILDNHSRAPDGYAGEPLWYTPAVSEEDWIDGWVSLAQRYAGNPVVVGFDLNNEPHDEASWATGNDATDWNKAAERCGNAILAVNPDALIIVEGVEMVDGENYWWGGNLAGVRTAPIELSDPSRLMYSTHEYGPEVFAQTWFSDSSFPDNMPPIWDEHFGFVMNENLGHVLVGEFGIRDASSAGGVQGEWFEAFMEYIGPSYSWTFWCWNPNSGDTGGILSDDWHTVNQWKVDILAKYLAPMLPAR